MEGGTIIQVSTPMFHSHCFPCPKILPLLITPCKAALVARADRKFQCGVRISVLCRTAVVSSCRVSLVDSLGRLDGNQQHRHHQQHVPELLASTWLCRGKVRCHVAACKRVTTAVLPPMEMLPPGKMLPGTLEAEAWALPGECTKYSCSTTGLLFLLPTE